MYLKALTVFLPFLAATSVAAQGTQTAVAVGGVPAVIYTSNAAFVFCSAEDCTGTCDVVDMSTVRADVANSPPIPFQSIYWYNPNNYPYTLYACVHQSYDCASRVQLAGNTCYDLYENGAPQYFTDYWYVA